MNIQEITKEYTGKLDHFDLQLLLADTIKKSKEFVIIHPEHKLTRVQNAKLKIKIERRIKGEPIAYILGHKEFYGLDFTVNSHTLVPRPETELMVELVAWNMEHGTWNKNTTLIDIGTGSGNIITSVAHTIEHGTWNMEHNTSYFAIDISNEALKIAKKNARLNGVDKKIKFIKSDLLSNFNNVAIKQCNNLIITANLPYLSKKIYNSAPIDVKKFEPKSALYSPKAGLAHYEKLLKQLKGLLITSCQLLVTVLLEISPEQKIPLAKLIKNIIPDAKIEFKKDLAGKWRVCKIRVHITPSP